MLSACEAHIKCKVINEDYNSLLNNLNTKSDTLLFIAKLNKVTEMEPSCMRAYHLMGFLEIGLGNFKKAKSVFKQSLQYDSKSIYSLYYTAYLYNIEGDNLKAFSYIDLAMKSKFIDGAPIDYDNFFNKNFDIAFSELLFLRGVILFDLSNFEKAKKDFLLVEKRGYNLNETYAYIANTYFSLNQKDSACYFYEKYTPAENIIINKNLSNVCKK